MNENKIFVLKSKNQTEIIAVLDFGFSYLISPNNSKT